MLSSVLITLALLPLPQAVPPYAGSGEQPAAPVATVAGHEDAPGTTEQAVSAAATDAAWERGTIEIGGLAGYGRGKVYDAQRTPMALGQVIGRFAVHFGPTFEGAMRGNFAIVVEGAGTIVDQEPEARGGGLNVLVRYGWAAGRWRPSLFAGTGVMFSDEPVPPGETTRNYASQGGVGLQYLVGEHVAIGGEYRFHHLSNNQQTESNPGINTHLVLFGISWFR